MKKIIFLCFVGILTIIIQSARGVVLGSPYCNEKIDYSGILEYQGSIRCGCIIIGPQCILTAAHCTKYKHYFIEKMKIAI